MCLIKEPKLQKRKAGNSIILVKEFSSTLPSRLPRIVDPLEVRGTATVKYDEITILVKILEKVNENEFIGEIVGFENVASDEYKDLSVNDKIKFQETNIIGYRPPAKKINRMGIKS